MEQKRVLWIITAVGIFLLVVIGAALILAKPIQSVEPSIASLQVQNDTWIAQNSSSNQNPNLNKDFISTDSLSPSEIDPNNNSNMNLDITIDAPIDSTTNQLGTNENLLPNSANVESMNVYTETANVYSSGTTTIDLNTLKANAVKPSSSVTAMNQVAADAVTSTTNYKSNVVANTVSKATTIEELKSANPIPEAVVKEDSTNCDTSVSAEKQSATTKKSAVVKNTTKSSSPKTTTKESSSSKPSAVKKASTSKIADQYWVQAASFSSKNNAEDARTALLENKIESEIFTYTDSNGKTYYRLRVGPYTTKTEAEYWRSRITLIEEFADSQSYVTNSSAKKQ